MELCIAFLRLLGKETLMNFGRPEPVFFGTIFQHMRFASLLCILSPFVLLKSKWYIVPISVAVVLTASNGFALAIGAGVLVYVLLAAPRYKWLILGLVGTVVLTGCYIGRDSWAVAFREGRIPVWLVIIKSWIFDTRINPYGTPDMFGISQSGPFDLKCFLFGHGLDTFYNLFPAYKADPSPFPQAHCSYLQTLWEFGLVGFSILMAFFAGLIKKLLDEKETILISGLVIIGVNALTAFPERMTQTFGLMVVFFALCSKKSKEVLCLKKAVLN